MCVWLCVWTIAFQLKDLWPGSTWHSLGQVWTSRSKVEAHYHLNLVNRILVPVPPIPTHLFLHPSLLLIHHSVSAITPFLFHSRLKTYQFHKSSPCSFTSSPALPSRTIIGSFLLSYSVFIRLEARLQSNIGFTLRRILAVFTRSAITPPKVNQFGWNVKHSEYIVGGCPSRFWAWSAL